MNWDRSPRGRWALRIQPAGAPQASLALHSASSVEGLLGKLDPGTARSVHRPDSHELTDGIPELLRGEGLCKVALRTRRHAQLEGLAVGCHD